MFFIGFITSAIFIATLISLSAKYINIYRVDYDLILKDGEGSVSKVLASFSRYYWNKSSYEKDVSRVKTECAHLRDNIITEDDFLLSLINEKFEVDLANVYITNTTHVIKPR